jgi:hypothetical protein
LPSWACHVRHCLGFTENGTTNKKLYCQRQPCGQKQLIDERVQRRMARIVQVKKLNTTVVCRMASQNAQLNPCHRWAVAADDHTGLHSYQLKARRSSSSGHAITNTGQLRSGKTLPGPKDPGSCCVMQSQDGRVRIWLKQHESMDPSCLVLAVQACCGCVLVWVMFSWHTIRPLIPTERRIKNSVSEHYC